ncbi:MAG: anti-sigma factor [Burkholderiales bacterium]|jgi:anti-sigma factor RsiW|nr:anti-sigma factor [Burkholderiales bacterium]
MNAERLTSQQVNAFVDGELDLKQQLEIESFVLQDDLLRSQVEALRAVSEAVRAKADYHQVPGALRERLGSQGLAASRHDSLPGRTLALARWWRMRPLMTGLTFAALLAWATTATLLRPSHDDLVMQEAVASHVRATLANRLIDVASSDRHTVKPWLSSRLDFAPPVKDVGPAGATLLGGRVDYVDGHPVAALVYRQRQHVINLFVWPTTEHDKVVGVSALRGFNVAHEVRSGMAYWAVSDINREELMALLAGQASGGDR